MIQVLWVGWSKVSHRRRAWKSRSTNYELLRVVDDLPFDSFPYDVATDNGHACRATKARVNNEYTLCRRHVWLGKQCSSRDQRGSFWERGYFTRSWRKLKKTNACNGGMTENRILRRQIGHTRLECLVDWSTARWSAASKSRYWSVIPGIRDAMKVHFPIRTPRTSFEKMPSHTAFCASQSTKWP